MIRALVVSVRSRMVREGGELAVGTAVGQLMPALAAPIISRLFSPAQFGSFAVFVGFVSILSVVAGGRYELGILIPRDDREAMRVAVVSTILILFTASVLLLVGTLGVLVASGTPDLFTVIAAAASVAGASLYQTLGYWLIRRRKFRELALQRAARGAMIAVLSVCFGLVGAVDAGLVLSLTIAYSGTAVVMIARVVQTDAELIRGMGDRSEIAASARKYVDFFKFSVIADMMNATAQQLPVFLLTRGFGSAAAGQLAMAQRTLGAPLGVVSTAMGDVFKEHAARERRETGSSRDSWGTAVTLLGVGSALMFIFAWSAGPMLFRWLLGPEWLVAGQLVRLLAPFYALALLVSPLSRILYVVQWQRLDLLWQVTLFVSLGAGLVYTTTYCTLKVAVLTYSLTYSFLYLAYFALARRAAMGGER